MENRGNGPGRQGGGHFFRKYPPGEPRPMLGGFERECLAIIDQRCTTTIPGHELHVLRLEQDQHALRIEYEATPPLSWEKVSWSWSAQDDAGNTYDMAGGAFGRSPDGHGTQGVLSLTPLLRPEARRLRIVLRPAILPGWEEHEWTLDVELTHRAP